jgi:hypothetical protein
MGYNMPEGATTDQYDHYCGYDQPDNEYEYEEPPEPEENEVEVITEAEMLEALAEEAGDRAYDCQEEYRLFPATIGPFEPPVVRQEQPLRLPPQQGKLFQEVA